MARLDAVAALVEKVDALGTSLDAARDRLRVDEDFLTLFPIELSKHLPDADEADPLVP